MDWKKGFHTHQCLLGQCLLRSAPTFVCLAPQQGSVRRNTGGSFSCTKHPHFTPFLVLPCPRDLRLLFGKAHHGTPRLPRGRTGACMVIVAGEWKVATWWGPLSTVAG